MSSRFTRLRLVLTAVALVAGTACGGASIQEAGTQPGEGALKHGTTDSTRRFVVALVQIKGQSVHLLESGVLVGPRQVVGLAIPDFYLDKGSKPTHAFFCTSFLVATPKRHPECYVAVERVAHHPGWGGLMADGLGLVTLAADAPVPPLAILDRPIAQSDVGDRALLAAFGPQKDSHSHSGTRRSASSVIRFVDRNPVKPKQALKNLIFLDRRADGKWTGDDVVFTSAGPGDDGGAMLIRNGAGQWVLAGLLAGHGLTPGARAWDLAVSVPAKRCWLAQQGVPGLACP
jgi:hypothetical protein